MKRNLWYKHAVLYCLDVETYFDGNGDGVGDFGGLTARLDYIAGLGVTCLWLLPFFPTPNRDNGYDVMDYYSVDPRLGTLGDFVDFMTEARERGLRVIIDLVINHTSDQHPWFEAARQDRGSPYHHYYVWSDTKPEDADEGIIFPGVQETTWSYEEGVDAYYLHRFYKHQPDLNIANEEVREEIRKIMGFWLELGVSGFRVDAAPFVIELKGIEGTAADIEVDEPYDYLREFRDFLSWRRGDAILLAEANVAMDRVPDYFGDGTKLHMLFNFMLNQHLFLALAREEATPLVEGFRKPPDIPSSGQWANFLRNHDELDLGRLSEEEREEVFKIFAPDETMRLYDRGIRRRLPPMLGDARKLRLAHSLLLTLPGTPVLRYGEEIGMGDNLELNERNSVRTPMQWSGEPNGGFSTAPEEDLIRPLIKGEPYGFEQVNVADARLEPDSLLNWMERAVRTRRDLPEFGWGEARILDTGDPAVFAHLCTWRGGAVMAVHNFSEEARTVTLDLSEYDARKLIDLLGDKRYDDVGSSHEVALDGYGYRWFRLDSVQEGRD